MNQPVYERRGAHRPGGLGPAGALPWLVAAIAIIAIVAWATGWWGGTGQPRAGSNTVSAGPSATTSGTRSPSPSGSRTSPAASPPNPTGTVDRTRAVTVLNSTGRAGLAAGAADTLRRAGWAIRSTGNSNAGGPTTVYYGRASLRATAAAVAADLGASAQVRESADFGSSRITVVLGADYQG